MPIDRTDFENLTEADLQELIDAAVPESMTVEYKREPYGNSDSEKKEALKDITSFANAVGGHLIIGIEEREGIPIGLPGVRSEDIDALTTRLESLIRDGVEPRIINVRIGRIPLSSGGAAVVLRIPQSWNPPHRVSSGGRNRFYIRNSAGAHEASVEELRVLFTSASEVRERIRDFRATRIGEIVAGRATAPLPAGGRLAVHLIPLSSFSGLVQIDPRDVCEVRQRFIPIGVETATPRYNLDGFANIRGGDECYGYTQVFRDGIVEATKASILSERDGNRYLSALKFARYLVKDVERYFIGLKELDVPAPVVLMVTLQGVHQAKLWIRRDYLLEEDIRPFPDRELMFLPEVILDQYQFEDQYTGTIRPIFDALWNAADLPKCAYYGEDGSWNPPQ